MSAPLPLGAVNALDEDGFVAHFGDIAEHSAWVAKHAAASRPFADRDAMVAAFETAMRSAGEADILCLIRAHPDLAGRAAIDGTMADASKREQAGVGLDRLTMDEYVRFIVLNDNYKRRFGFPFIFAVKGATKQMILAAFEARLGNDAATEFETAMTQIARIFRFRIEDKVAP